MTSSLKEKLSSLNTATPQSVKLLTSLFVPVTFKKGMVLNIPDHSFPMLYFIEKGLLRGYFFHNNGEYTAWLMDNGFLLPSGGLFCKEPSIEYVQFLSDSEGWSLNLAKAETLAQHGPLMYRILLEIYEMQLHEGRRRELLIRLNTSNQRLEFAKKLFGNLLDKATHPVLASFLNIETKYLYKIMKQRGQK